MSDLTTISLRKTTRDALRVRKAELRANSYDELLRDELGLEDEE
ncbi:hypothetical protein [Natronococcus sp.]